MVSPSPPPSTERRARSPDLPGAREAARHTDRSRSPGPDRKRKKTGGFRWKEKKKDYNEDDNARNDAKGSGGGYRDRYQQDRRRDGDYSRGGDDRYRRDRYEDRDRYRDRDDRHRDGDRDRGWDRDRDRDRDNRYGGESYRPRERSDQEDTRRSGRSDQDRNGGSTARDRDAPLPDEESTRTLEQEREKKKEKREKKKKDKPAVSVPQEAMIVVHVNDRLGTKAAIACLPSDPIKIFKMQVAAQIGREPHEILLKRQGERPFKDQLTLEDYGIGNGVQLDLEVDTGD